MDAVTYPSNEVGAFLREKVIALRLPHDHKPLAEEFGVTQTPCLILLDREGAERHRATGFLPPEEFLAAMQLGFAKIEVHRRDFSAAEELLDELLQAHPGSLSAPEAITVRGLCRFENTNDPHHLKRAYEKLKSEFPQSEWTRRTFRYRLL